MQFTSVVFIIFYMIAVALIRIAPARMRKGILIAANIAFYLSAGLIGGAFFICVAILSFAAAHLLKQKSISPKISWLFGIIIVLILYAYHMSGAYYPAGISFYALMAVGYVMDVAGGKCEPVERFGDYFLCLGFFPIVLSGPIEKIQNLATQLDHIGEKRADASCGTGGPGRDRDIYCFVMILWGFLEKKAMSDIAGILIAEVFDSHKAHSWVAVVLMTVLYAFQLYADFDGYSNIAYGCAGILGIDIMRNFKQPYLSAGVREFWSRWHISLSNWLKDYVYIPLGGSRKGKVRRQINVLITFAVSGLWHGIGLNFLVWGLLHGIYQVGENLINNRIRLPKAVKIVITFILVDAAWFFFRAGSMSNAIGILSGFGEGLHQNLSAASFIGEFAGCNLNYIHMLYMAGGFVLLFIMDILRYRGTGIYSIYVKIPTAVRFVILYALIFWIIFASLSVGSMNISDFIYGQF